MVVRMWCCLMCWVGRVIVMEWVWCVGVLVVEVKWDDEWCECVSSGWCVV